MSLTDMAVRQAKATGKNYTLPDFDGPSLAVTTSERHDTGDGTRDLPDFFVPFQSWRTGSVNGPGFQCQRQC
ncbi:hypothetical protein [Burkholderia sp. TSV86]|uniref:hypothetical protein n=1 Tax=Burkholderia sp. TSV86 TaxID=1385594 RepID=UPI000AA4925A